MRDQPVALLPELLLLLGAVTTLLVGVFQPRHRQWVAGLVAVAALLASLVSGALAADGGTYYAGSWAVDGASAAARVIVPAAALLTLALAVPAIRGDRRETEFFVLVLLASLGTVVLAGASDLLVLAVGYLLASIPLYALTGWRRDPRGAEAALKTYLFGALLGVVMLLGVAVLTGVGGGRTTYAALASGLAGAPSGAVALGLVGVLAGLLFKAGAVPVHFWVPDATEGASPPAAAFLTTVPKIGGLIAAYRLLVAVPTDVVDWPVLIAVVAAASMTLGNLAAFAQTVPTRLLAYSTISQVGYLLMAVAVAGRDSALRALLGYLAAYAVTNLAAFAVVAALPRLATLADYRGLARRRPGLAAVLLVALLGLVGTPPTAVFAGKVSVFAATWDAGMGWLVAVAALNTLASLYYYLRWLAPVFLSGPAPAGERGAGPGEQQTRPARAAAAVAGVGALGLGVAAGPLLALVSGGLAR